MKKSLIIIFMIVLVSSYVFAAPISSKLHVSGYLTDGGGTVETDGTQAYSFNITTNDDCTGLIYSNATSLTVNNYGMFSYYLPNIVSNFTEQSYLCIYKNGILRETMEIVPTASSYSATSWTNWSVDKPSYNTTAQLKAYFDLLYAPILNTLLSSLNVSGNTYLIGNTTFDGGTMFFNSLNNNLTGSFGLMTTGNVNPMGILSITNTTEVTPTEGVNIFTENRGEESLFGVVGKQGYDTYVGEDPAYSNVFWLQPTGTTSSTGAMVAVGGTFTAALGTALNLPRLYTSVKDSMQWFQLSSTTVPSLEIKAIGVNVGRGNASLPMPNGGFKAVFRYTYTAIPDATANNISGMVGMTASISAYTNISNNVLGALSANSIWAGFMKGNQTLGYFSTNVTAGAVNYLYNCGSDYPTNTTINAKVVYETTIFARPSAGNVSFYTKRLDNTSIAPCVFTMAGNDPRLPLPDVPLGWHTALTKIVTTSSATITMGINKIYQATDN